MLTLRCCLGLLFAALATVTAGATELGGESEAHVRECDAARLAALVKPDLAKLGEILGDDLVYIHSSGRVQSKAEYLALIAAGTLRYRSMRYEDPPRIRVFGASTAIVTGTTSLESQPPSGPPIARVLRTTATYIKRRDRWELVSFQGTPVPPPTSGVPAKTP